ncbi:unnamed protein product [Closterium sp. NIES-53]
MTSLCRSGQSGDGGGGSSGSGGGRTSSHCGAVWWGVFGGGQMQLQRSQRESLPPQQLREWYASKSGGGGTSGSRCAAIQLGVSGGGLVQLQRRLCESLTPQQLCEWYAQRGASRSSAHCPYVIRTGAWAGQTCGTVGHTQSHCFSCLSNTWRTDFGTAAELPHWLELLWQGVDIFALDYDAILTAMYALPIGTEGDYSLSVLPDLGIEAAALGASESSLPSTAPAQALHTFTLDSGASRCFFCDSTTLTPLSAPVPVRLADPFGGPVLARSSTVLPCLAITSGSLSALHLPSLSTNLVSTGALQDTMVTTTTPGGQRVSICTYRRTGPHLATFTRRPGSSLYTPTTEPPQVAVSAHVSASGPVAPPCSCRLHSHQTLLWHHRLGHPSLPRLRGMHSHLLVSGLPRSRPPLPPSPAPPCLPCVEGRQPRVNGQGRERLFLLVVDDYTQYTTVFPLRSKEVVSSPLTSPQQNGIAERHIGLVMEVAHTSMILPAAPYFLRPFAVRYAAHLLNLWPRVSLPDTLPTLRWTGEVGDASVFRVWGSRAFVRDTYADKLSARAIPCVFLGVPPDAPGWQFHHPTSHRVFPSQDVTFDKFVPFYLLFPYLSAPPPPPPLFLAPDPLPGTVPVGVAVDSSAAGGAASRGAEPGGAELGGAESEGAGSGGAEPGGAEPGCAELAGVESGGVEPEVVELGGAECEGAESWGAEPRGTASSGGPAGASPRRTRLRSGAAGAGDSAAGDAGAGGVGVTHLGGAGVTAGADGTGGAAAAGPGGAGAGGRGAGGTGAGGARAGGAGAVGAEAGGTGAGGDGAGGARAVDRGAVGAGAGGAASDGTGAGGTVRPRPYFVPYFSRFLSRPASPARTGRRVPRPRPPPVPGTHAMVLRPSSVPLRVPLPPLLESSLLAVPDPESDRAHPPSPTVSRLLATIVPDPSFESTVASSLVAKLVDFPCRLNYATTLVVESECASPPSIGGECAIGTVKRPPGSPPAFKARYVARGFNQRQGVDYFQTFSPTPKMTTLRVLLYVAAPRDYELHSLDFSTAFFADPSLFIRTETLLLQFYVLVYITRDRARRTITLTQSHMLHQVLQRFGFQLSSPQPTPLSTSHSLSAPPLDESVEPSGPYPELVGCLMYPMMCTRPNLAYPLSLVARYVAPATQRSSQGYTFSLGFGYVLWWSTRSSLVLSSSCEAEIYAGAMAAQELRWLTYPLTDLGEQPCSPPVLYIDNKAMIALCQEHKLEHRTKHIALR